MKKATAELIYNGYPKAISAAHSTKSDPFGEVSNRSAHGRAN